MNRDELVTRRPDPKQHHQAVVDLTGKTFGQPYWGWLTYCREVYFDAGPYDGSASTIGLLNGEVVTHWGVWGFDMRVGRARLRVAGIGAVSTHGEMRKRGLMARTIAAAVPAMRDAGYDLSVLFGIPDFYGRFGYVRAWVPQAYVVSVGDLPTDRPAGRLRRIAPRHRDDLARLYNATHRGLTGTAVRPTYLRRDKSYRGHLWTDAAGRAAGYVFTRARHGHFDVYDQAGDAAQVLGVVRHLARRAGRREVRFSDLHYDGALARRLRRGSCRLEAYYSRSGGTMVRTLNLASALGKMAGELSARLRGSHLGGWRGELLVADGRERACLRIDRGAVRPAGPARTKHAVRGGDEIAQLLLGTDDPRETVEAHGIRLSGDARRLVEVLFPNQHPALGSWDHF